MSIRNWEEEQEIKRKKAAGWRYNNDGILVPPDPRRLNIPSTSDPDYYADSILDEIKSVHNSVIECFKDLEKHLKVI